MALPMLSWGMQQGSEMMWTALGGAPGVLGWQQRHLEHGACRLFILFGSCRRHARLLVLPQCWPGAATLRPVDSSFAGRCPNRFNIVTGHSSKLMLAVRVGLPARQEGCTGVLITTFGHAGWGRGRSAWALGQGLWRPFNFG
jgi:hypothetical protein